MARLTWGDVMVAAAAASTAVGPDAPVERKRLHSDIARIISVTGRARDYAAALTEGEQK